MRVEQLEALAAVTRLGSIRRASEALHLSQPALSETIQNLERELRLSLLDRRRTGSRISAAGSELLPYIADVIEAVDRLRSAAGEQRRSTRPVRIGTVNAATAALVTPAIQEFHAARAATQVEVLNTQQVDIHRLLLDGGLDLGLVNLLSGDDVDPEVETTELLRGRAVLCCRTDSPLARHSRIGPEQLLQESLIGMRSGYVMNRFAHRFFRQHEPWFAYTTDGAEMGKLMVAQGLGVTLLPDFSIMGDPLERQGILTFRPLDDEEGAAVVLMLQRRRSRHSSSAARQLHSILVARAASFQADLSQAGRPG